MSISVKSFSIFQRDAFLFLVNLATGIYVARAIGPSALGVWVILSLVPAFAEAMFRTKADNAAIYFIGKGTFSRDDVLTNLNFISFLTSGFALLVFYLNQDLIYRYLLPSDNGQNRLAFQMVALQIPLQAFYLNFSYFHLAEERVNVFNKMVIVHALTYTVTACTLLLFLPGLEALVIASVFCLALSLAFGFWKAQQTDLRKGAIRLKTSLALCKYGFNFYVGNLISQLQTSGPALITVAALSSSQLAFLSQGQGFGRLLHKFSEPISVVLFPRVSRLEDSSSIEIVCVSFRLLCIVMVSGGIGLGIFAELLVVLLYGEEFKPTGQVIILLLPGIVLTGIIAPIRSFFEGTGRARFMPWMMVFPVLAQSAALFIFSDVGGLPFVALTVSLSLASYGTIVIVTFLHVSKTSFMELVPSYADFMLLIKIIKKVFGLSGLSK